MRVMVVGGGGREHALAERLRRSPRVTRVFCAPGNGGTAAIADNLAVDPEDVAGVVALAKLVAVDFVVIGPEGPLVAGLADALADAGILAFGPRQAAARLEGSKVWSKTFMQRHGVPTAEASVWRDPDEAAAFVEASQRPWVVKADGLAAGKGVIVAGDVPETLSAIDRIMRRREFGDAGGEILLEERLVGQEVSYHVVLDGQRALPLAAAQDHKRLRDGDRGPNTGGMGAYSPPPVVTHQVEQRILNRVVEPTLRGLAAEGLEYRGVLFIGLMIDRGEPRVIEYNVRFGDPECEVLMARYGGDLLPLLLSAAQGDLSDITPRWEAPSALSVVIAAGGYPGSVQKGTPIRGLEQAGRVPGVQVFHAGTKADDTAVVTNGGRVLCVTAAGPDIHTVAASAYEAVARIEFEGMQYRSDIGHHARERG